MKWASMLLESLVEYHQLLAWPLWANHIKSWHSIFSSVKLNYCYEAPNIMRYTNGDSGRT